VIQRNQTQIVPTKGRFAPGENLGFRVYFGTDLTAALETDDVRAVLELSDLGHLVGEHIELIPAGESAWMRVISIPAGEVASWEGNVSETHRAGRGAHIQGRGPTVSGLACRCAFSRIGAAEEGKAPIAVASTAIEIAPAETSVTRYAFHTRYDNDVDVEAAAEWLSSIHATHVQFYDWMYRHDCLVPRTEEYDDPLGRPLRRFVVRACVDAYHARGMEAIAYGAVYGASAGFYREHPGWALFGPDKRAHTLVDWLHIMNPARHSPWRRHIINEYADACTSLGFDGIHMDTYGRPKRAYDGEGNWVDLEQEFPSLVQETKGELDALGDGRSTLFFNAVNNWPSEALSSTPVRSPYVEVWSPNTSYGDLVQLARENRMVHGKTPVLAAYLSPFDPQVATDLDKERGSVAALLYATAVINTAGATHLVLGENARVLYHPYYVTNAPIPSWAEPIVRRFADFGTAYGSLLGDIASRDITRDHAHGPDDEFAFEGAPTSASPRMGAVWATIRETRDHYVVSLVNLTEIRSENWNASQSFPTREICGLTATMDCAEELGECFTDTPDPPDYEPSAIAGLSGAALPECVALQSAVTGADRSVRVLVPPFKFWRILWVEKQVPAA
jgi:dextranase